MVFAHFEAVLFPRADHNSLVGKYSIALDLRASQKLRTSAFH